MRLVVFAGAGDLGWCCDELVVADEDEIELDLSALTFVSPLFLVRLRAWLDHQQLIGGRVTVIPPVSANVRNYMSRMHLAEGLGDGVDLPLPTVRENPMGDRLIALTRLDA